MAEINTPIEQLWFEERALISARGSTVGTMTIGRAEVDDDIEAVRLRDMPRNPERIGVSGIASTSCGGKYH